MLGGAHVDPHRQPGCCHADVAGANDPGRRPVHRTGGALQRHRAKAREVPAGRQAAATEGWVGHDPWSRHVVTRDLGRDVRTMQVVRRLLAKRPIGPAKMLAKERVELAVVRRRVVVAVPPEPVAALGGENRVERDATALRTELGRPRREALTELAQLGPGAAVVAVAHPDTEVGVDPRPRKEPCERLGWASRRGAHLHRVDVRGLGQALIQRPQKRAPATRVVLPGILAVEDHRHRHGLGAARQVRADAAQARHEVVHGRAGRPALVGEPDEVRQAVVAKEHAHFPVPAVDGMRLKALGRPGGAASERARPHQDVLVGGHPAEPRPGDCRGRQLRHAAFWGPHPGRPRSEPALVCVDGAGQLQVGIRRPLERRVEHGRARMRLAVGGRVTEQRQDRMEVRRGRELELPALGSGPVGRHHPAQDLEFHRPQRVLVVLVEAVSLVQQPPHPRVGAQQLGIHPGQLLPHLKVA